MSDYHCKHCKREAKNTYRAYDFVPYGLTVENGYYDDETIWDVVDEDGDTVPMRTPEFNGTVGDA